MAVLTQYFDRAMEAAKYKLLENGSYFGEIQACPGVWANESSLEECRRVLREVLEDWVLVGLKHGHQLPIIAGIDLNAVGTLSQDA